MQDVKTIVDAAIRRKPRRREWTPEEHEAVLEAMHVNWDVGTVRRRGLGWKFRTPPWANVSEIEDLYALSRRLTADTGVVHEVDHVIPLHGRKVSGLHVAENVRILRKKENNRKVNVFLTDWDREYPGL